MLGDVVVYREVRGNLVMSNRPRKRDMLTPHQEKIKSRFMWAVEYAKSQIADPVSKALYQPNLQSRFTSAYAAALADYLSVPVIRSIDTSHYAGLVGDKIYFNTFDDFGVASAQISIYDADGNLLEQGEPVLMRDSREDYIYKATISNSSLPGTKVCITARDRPGNMAMEEKIL